MKFSTQIRPVSYLKNNAEEIARTLALLKILALGKREIGEGRAEPAEKVFKRLREKLRNR